MAKKRTRAQRAAAAKAAWAARRAKEAVTAAPTIGGVVEAPDTIGPLYLEPPVTMTATKEGAEFFLTIANNGSVSRTRVSAAALRKIGLDALALVG